MAAGKQENVSLKVDRDVTSAVASLRLDKKTAQGQQLTPFQPAVANQQRVGDEVTELDPAKEAEKAIHRGFMNEALEMARLALRTNETPVGCVLVYRGRIIAKGMNATNVTRNGTRHAELMALSALLSYAPGSEMEAAKGKNVMEQDWADADPKDGRIYPYGQKFHPSPFVDKLVIKECILYVTVEPCVMCASMLRQLGIRKVYFGAVNDKFGGTGGVFRIHKNSGPAVAPLAPTRPRPERVPRGPLLARRASTNGSVNAEGNPAEGTAKGTDTKPTTNIAIAEGTVPDAGVGDGGNVEPGYDVEGGWGRDEAVTLLRQFYVQENGRAPVPRKKEGRAARLAAIMEKEGKSPEGLAKPISPTNGTPTNAASPAQISKQENMAPSKGAMPHQNGTTATATAPITPTNGASFVPTIPEEQKA